MIERAFEEARQHRDNAGVVRQFAITQARRLLEVAGVVDPAIKKL